MYSLLACGSNGSAQLGIDNCDDQTALVPCMFAVGSPQTEVAARPAVLACGGNHSFVLLEDGRLFSCGDNTFGQCALSTDIRSVTVFTEVPHHCKWVAVACGWEFSVLTDENRQLYVCGAGLKGELGIRDLRNSQLVRLDVPFVARTVKCGVTHTIVQAEDGTLYGWGNGRKGQLGKLQLEGAKKAYVEVPTILDFGISSIEDIELGADTTFILAEGHIRAFGKLNFDIEVTDVHTFKAMWSSVHYEVHKTGLKTIGSYGNNSHGQQFPGFGSHVDRWAVGSEHGILVSSNKVFAWGWGEHGNCGVRPTEKEVENVVFDKLNLLYEGPDAVVGVFGGCATTWVVIQG